MNLCENTLTYREACLVGRSVWKVCMRASKLVKVAVTCGVLLLCVFAFAGCSESEEPEAPEIKVEGLTGGVAATVNGVEIEEDTITTYIQNYRRTYGLTAEAAWARWLIENEYTPQTLRESTINTYVSQELIKKAAEDYEIKIPSSEIDAYVKSVSVYYGDEEAWQKALENEGITEEEYRESIEVALLQRHIKDAVDPEEEPTDAEIYEYALNHIHTYEGAKKSEHILFAASDSKQAEEVLQKLQNGEVTFEEAAAQYSTDPENSQEGGNKGWNVLDANMATAYSSALNDLEEGEISEPVTSEYGIHIIKCTDVYEAPEHLTEINQIPEEFIEDMRATLESSNKNDAYTAWYESYYDTADVVINEMPEKVPYNIDLDKFKEQLEASISEEYEEPEEELEEALSSDSLAQNEPKVNTEEEVLDPTLDQPAEIE